MATFNKVILIGYLCNTPELKVTPNGVHVTTFRIAVQRRLKNQTAQADFFEITAFAGTADFVTRYFSKGKCILVEGELRQNNYTDNAGNKRTRIYVAAGNCSFVEPAGNSGAAAQNLNAAIGETPSYAPPDTSEGFEDIDGDLPF